MFRRWPFWRTLIDNAQMILAKADLVIARLYADLVEDKGMATTIFNRIEAEYLRTVDVILQITGQSRICRALTRLAALHPAAQPLC